jgi:cell division protein FtsI (penicillin-binding protein 3)
VRPAETLNTSSPTHLNGQTGFKNRMGVLMVCCVLAAGAITARAAYIQFWANPRLEQMSRKQFQSKVLIRPRRGIIEDRAGEPLAVNLETNSLAANPLKIENRRTLVRLLTKAMDLPAAVVSKRLSEKKEFVWIKRHLSEAELARLKRFKIIDNDGDLLTGLWMVRESERVYPHGELAAHTLGDVNIDSEGVEGVELWQNEKMRGKFVSVAAIKDALGRPSLIDAVAAKHVEDGEPVQLTLDASLQYAVEQALHDAVVKTDSKAGAVVVMNAANGEILAMANQPAFNPNMTGIPLDRRRNRVLTDGYEPGSTLKAVLIASAMTNGWKLTDQVYGELGSFKVQGKKISEAEAKEKFAWINLRKIIQHSSNVGAAKVALKLGADKFIKTLKDYGFGSKTGSGFPGEISGRLPARKEWQPLTLANVGFGQGILVTPMQMTRAYASFLNGGFLVTPKLIKDDGLSTETPKRVISEKVAADVVNALQSVTEDEGTGLKARLDGYDVAGKTGTAQVVDPATGAYSRSRHIASFIGFATGVEPKLVIFTSLDDPRGVYFAAETAAPLFHEVLNAVVNRFSIPPKNDTAPMKLAKGKNAHDRIQLSQAKSVALQDVQQLNLPEETTLQWQGATPKGLMIWKMPSLKGMTAREAIRVLHGHSFHLEVRGDGVIQSQSPEEGKALAEGDLVRLALTDP